MDPISTTPSVGHQRFQFWVISTFLYTALLISNGARATAILNVNYDYSEVYAEMTWRDTHDPDNPASKPDGTVESQMASGRMFGASPNKYVSATSNMGSSHALTEVYSGASDTTVRLGSNYDDDCPGCLPGNGIAKASWDLAFDIAGDGATLDVSGWLPNSGPIINQLTLTDLTTGISNVYKQFTADLALLNGHSYTLSALSLQQGYGLDDLSEVDAIFRNVQIQVPEPAAWMMLATGFAVIGLRQSRTRGRGFLSPPAAGNPCCESSLRN